MESELDYLFLAAHPDDAELFCGGTIARMIDQGYRVGVLDLTQGESATTGTVAERQAETAAANEILGITWRRNLSLPDSQLADITEHRTPVVAVIRETRPGILVAPLGPCRHPDHTALWQLARSVHFFSGAGGFKTPSGAATFRPLKVLFHLETMDVTPSFVIDISAYAEQKRAAIDAYASQFKSGKTVIGSGAFHETMRARDAYYGGLAGVAHGEAYVTEGILRLDDPLHNARHG